MKHHSMNAVEHTERSVFDMKDTREHILAIAFQRFFRKGFKAVTMSELVEASGLSKGAFYHYFSSKEALYNESMEKHLISYFDVIQLNYNAGLTLRENLKTISKNFIELTNEFKRSVDQKNPGLNVYQLYIQTALNNPDFKNKLVGYFNQFLEILNTWFKTAQSSGEIKADLDTHLLAIHISALMEGLYILDSFELSEAILSRIDKIIDQFFDQIETKSIT